MERINVTRSSMPLLDEYIDEIKVLWDNCWLSNRGVKHREFEKLLSNKLDVKNVALFANGHVALEVAIDAFGFPRGSEVITTPYTHCSTTHAIVRNGLVPVFCDVNDNDYTIDVNLIESKITPKTVAIVPTHVYGTICDVVTIDKIAKKYNLKVIYDAAHAFGVTFNGKGIANWGDASMFSCHATKVFHTIEGGITVFNDEKVFSKIDMLTNFGFVNAEEVDFVSTNARMNEFEAAMGICNLRHIDDEIAKRANVARVYETLLSGVSGIKLLPKKEGISQNFSYFPVFFDGYKKTRNQIQEELKENNVFARKYFYPITPDLACYSKTYGNTSATPVAKHAAEVVLTLPLYADLSIENAKRICEIILN